MEKKVLMRITQFWMMGYFVEKFFFRLTGNYLMNRLVIFYIDEDVNCKRWSLGTCPIIYSETHNKNIEVVDFVTTNVILVTKWRISSYIGCIYGFTWSILMRSLIVQTQIFEHLVDVAQVETTLQVNELKNVWDTPICHENDLLKH